MYKDTKVLSPKIDIVFKMIFGEQKHENITKKLIEDIIEEKVDIIKLEETPYLQGSHIDDKVGIIDVRATINNKNLVDIEMQVLDKHNIEKRILFYWAKLYLNQIKRGEKYSKLERSISIIFLDYEIEKLKELPTHTKWQIRNSKNGKTILTEELEIHIIELPKIMKKEEEGNLKKWILFLENPDGEEIKKMAEKEKEIKEAIETLEEISQDEQKARLAELREKYIMDREEEMETARDIGLEEGRKQGIKEGIKEGREKGKKEGIEEGTQKEKINIAKKLKEKNMSTIDIAEITGLSKSEIETL